MSCKSPENCVQDFLNLPIFAICFYLEPCHRYGYLCHDSKLNKYQKEAIGRSPMYYKDKKRKLNMCDLNIT